MEKSVVIEEFTSDWALQLGLTIHHRQANEIDYPQNEIFVQKT